jgi:hypothetical protein
MSPRAGFARAGSSGDKAVCFSKLQGDRSMAGSSSSKRATPFELRFNGLFNRGTGFSFPCDALGHVDVGALSDKGRENYFHACAVVGSELSAPRVLAIVGPD